MMTAHHHYTAPVAGYWSASHRRLVMLLLVFLLNSAKADILVYQDEQLLEGFRDFPAQFGVDIPDTGIKVRAVRANPIYGCSDLEPPPENGTTRFAVIIARYNCTFGEKVRFAQKAGYAVAIVHNVGSNDLEHMSANHADDILIPSVFIGESNGLYIIDSFLYPGSYSIYITSDVPFNLNNNLIIPFAIVVGLCFIIMVCFMVIRCIRERRRMLRHRLPSSVLKRIPIVKFVKGMQYDTCAICLDDYVDNERLRVLPCFHAYHVKCIDPWLTKNRRVCPICKRKVFVRGEPRRPRRRSSTDSMSSTDADENTPLLNTSENVAAALTTNAQAAPSQESEPLAAAAVSSARDARAPRVQRRPNEAHVVNINSDDDELLDDSNVHNTASRQVPSAPSLRRFNPFERVVQSQMTTQQRGIDEGGESPYSPIGEEQATASVWKRFIWRIKNIRGPASERMPEEEDDDDDPPAVSRGSSGRTTNEGTSRIAINAATASNNILNSNLSGSFHGEDTTDDEMVGASHREESKRRQVRSAPNLPSTSGLSASGSSVGRVGVAALPNVNFNPSQSSRESPGRRSNRSGNNSRGNLPM